MALITVPSTTKPMVDPVEQTYKQCIAMSSSLAYQLEMQHTALFNKIWKNPDVTVEQILIKYGTDATKLFQVSSAIQDVLIAVNPNYKPLVPLCQVYFNEDGSATTIAPSGII